MLKLWMRLGAAVRVLGWVFCCRCVVPGLPFVGKLCTNNQQDLFIQNGMVL